MVGLLRTLWLVAIVLVGSSCSDIVCPPRRELSPGGLYVAHVDPHGCDGCEQLERGDLIQSVDGEPAEGELAGLTDGSSHELGVWKHRSDTHATVTITRTAPTEVRTIDAGLLRQSPKWARRRMFGRAIPELLLIGEGGRPLTGLDLLGQKHVVVLFDWAAASDRQNAALCMQVLQKAQADLLAAGIRIVFAQVQHPTDRKSVPMNEAELQAFFVANQIGPAEGGPLPPPPLYRMPNRTERGTKPAGIEPIDYAEYLGEAPNILLIDERGIIRWHSAGAVSDPEGMIIPMVYTINEAVLFALAHL